MVLVTVVYVLMDDVPWLVALWQGWDVHHMLGYIGQLGNGVEYLYLLAV